jgi:glucose dehydrogenase
MRLVGCGRGDGADHAENGTPTKVLMDANRNGFFYVIDRTT